MTTRYIREAVLRMCYVQLSATITFLCSYYFSEQTIYLLALVYIRTALPKRADDVTESFTLPPEPRFIYTELTEAFGVSILISVAVTL